MDIRYDGKVVGRVTSAVPGVVLAYVRTSGPANVELEIGLLGSGEAWTLVTVPTGAVVS